MNKFEILEYLTIKIKLIEKQLETECLAFRSAEEKKEQMRELQILYTLYTLVNKNE